MMLDRIVAISAEPVPDFYASLLCKFRRRNLSTLAAHSLNRECAVAERNGDLFAADGGDLARCRAVCARV